MAPSNIEEKDPSTLIKLIQELKASDRDEVREIYLESSCGPELKCTTDSDAKELVAALSQLRQLTALTLDLPWNTIDDTAVNILIEGLNYPRRPLRKTKKEPGSPLQSPRNRPTRVPGQKLGSSSQLQKTGSSSQLQKSQSASQSQKPQSPGQPPELTTLALNLRGSFLIQRNSTGDLVAGGLSKGLRQLQQLTTLTLDLGKNSVTDAGLKDLSEAFGHLRLLTTFTLELGNNEIADDGVKDLAKALKDMTKLTTLTLKLGKNQFTAAGLQEVAEFISSDDGQPRQLTSLTLDLPSSRIDDTGAAVLAEGLSEMDLTSLTLNLQDNSIGDSGVSRLLTALIQRRRLMTLTLGLQWNPISDAGAKLLSDGLKHVKDLTISINSISEGSYITTNLGGWWRSH